MAVRYDQHNQLAICEKYTHVHVHAINSESANEPGNTAKWKLVLHTPQLELHQVHPCPIGCKSIPRQTHSNYMHALAHHSEYNRAHKTAKV